MIGAAAEPRGTGLDAGVEGSAEDSMPGWRARSRRHGAGTDLGAEGSVLMSHYCFRRSQRRHQRGTRQVPAGAAPWPCNAAASRGTGRARRPAARSIFCFARHGDAQMAEPRLAALGGRWSLPVLRPPSLHCRWRQRRRRRRRHLLGPPAAGMLLPFPAERGRCRSVGAAVRSRREEMLLVPARPCCRLGK